MARTTEQRAEIRRAIRSVLGQPSTVSMVCDSLPHLERGTIVREINYLRSRNSLVLNGRGRASRYVKLEI
jgi:hypothetical protein